MPNSELAAILKNGYGMALKFSKDMCPEKDSSNQGSMHVISVNCSKTGLYICDADVPLFITSLTILKTNYNYYDPIMS